MLLCFGLFLVLSSVRFRHEYHVSVTQLRYSPESKTLEISIRTFTDDLEKGLSLANNNKRFLLQNGDQNSPYIEQYLKKHVALANPARQIQPFQFIGKEQEADATWIYLEVPFSGNPEGWVMRHDFLMEVFDDQVNMVNAKWGSERKTYLFKKGKPVQAL
ncbi:DUF6702 family protein [Arundinibacter roseus]|uniref:Uncharacterized protein n=1 Tax=Arundinibacter roseus TaxID=2070510 RepID=A0A4R4KQ16_9BACT|nr:DUF6702 family protein [Arundinibacter roseus]TDB68992.1 hypothetical protein EZE20_01240 [Arundinibacter roseus]